MKPTLAGLVHYRGRLGLKAMRAAVITATSASLDPRGVEAGLVPALDTDQHVHLWVWTPAATGPNAATGGFPEFNVPPGEPGEDGLIPPGTWSWPLVKPAWCPPDEHRWRRATDGERRWLECVHCPQALLPGAGAPDFERLWESARLAGPVPPRGGSGGSRSADSSV